MSAKPELNVEEIVWDLSIFYKNPQDPQIQSDMDWCREQVQSFHQAYQGKIAHLSVEALVEMLQTYEAIQQRVGRLGTFAYLNFATQTQNAEAGALMKRVEELGSELQRDMVFVELEWAALDDEKAETLLAADAAEPYRHYLRSMRKYRPHLLAESEEKLLAEISPVGSSAWTNLFEKVISKLEFGEQKRTEQEVLSDMYLPDRESRQKAAQELTEGLQSQLHIFTHIFNTLAADKMISDRLRKYPHWVRSRNLSNEIEDDTVQTLMKTVQSRYDIPQRYYRLKKQILGFEALYDYDRYAPLPYAVQKSISWEACRDTVLQAYSEFAPEMGTIAKHFFENNFIDAPVKAGKRGGAFAHPATPDTHPFVMVNYTGNLRDVATVAHELGHGIHQYLAAQKQTYFNTFTPLTTAESASVFGEMLVFQYQLAALDDPKEKLALLCNKLESIFATIFRQISMFSFEDMLHNARREEGELSEERINALWMESQRAMFGDSMELQDHYQIWWCYIPHFLQVPGYVYAYAFGELLVLALYQRYQNHPGGFAEKYLHHLLASGGNDTPANLLKPFEIDLNDPDFWNQGLVIVEKMLEDAETLYRELD